MTLPDLLVIALASCYWAFVLTKKPGPFDVFQRQREKNSIGGLLLCAPCLVFWIAVAFWLIWQTPAAPLVTISAIAGGASLAGYYTGMWQQ